MKLYWIILLRKNKNDVIIALKIKKIIKILNTTSS